MNDLTLEQYAQRERDTLEGFLLFYAAAAQALPDYFPTSQAPDLWDEELRAYAECRNVNRDCSTCDPTNCHLVTQRLSGARDT